MPVINPNTPVMNVPVPVVAPANTNKPKPKQPKAPAQPQAPQDSTQDVPPLTPPEPPLNSIIMPWVPTTGKVKASRRKVRVVIDE